MAHRIKGNIRGLAPSEIKALTKLETRRLGKDELISRELAKELFEVSEKIGRRVGLIVSREGHVEEVVVGNKEIIYLPDLGRYRLGKGRLRRLRLIFTDLSTRHIEPTIPHDIYTDLEKLRLDAVVGVKGAGNKIALIYAYNTPPNQTGATHTESVPEVGNLELDWTELIERVEADLEQSRDVSIKTNSDRAVLVGVYPKNHPDPEGSMAELSELARTAGVKIADKIFQHRDLDPRTLIGKGKLEEVVLRCLRLEAGMIIFDTEIKPAQWRAITNSTELKVLDRSMIILDIFAGRASTSEGRLQVELAQLKYNLPRLVELDAGLSRLSGGIGGRGPGETKLEIGRRRIRDRIAELDRQIDKLGQQRELRKKKRSESDLPLVSILGYTNVGKSTLFNALTQSSVLVENKLFATLDTSRRKKALPGFAVEDPKNFPAVIFSDTVGFIRELPDELRTAFRATLEELREADLLLHVLDASDPAVHERKKAVDEIIKSMELESIPVQIVLNKIDVAEPEVVRNLINEFGALAVSATRGQGLAELIKFVGERFYSYAEPEADVNLESVDV